MATHATMDPDTLAAVEELRRSLDRIEGRIAHVEAMLELRLAAVEKTQADQETRLRSAGETLVRLTTVGSLAQAANAALAVLLSALAAYLGTR